MVSSRSFQRYLALSIYVALIVLAWPNHLSADESPNPAKDDTFRIYVNGRALIPGQSITSTAGSAVTFSIKFLTKPLPATIDPIGNKDLVYALGGAGDLFEFTTSYEAGTFQPTITVGSSIIRLALSVSPAPPPRPLPDLSGLAWPAVALFAFWLLASDLKGVLNRFTSIKVGPTEVTLQNLQNSLDQAVKSTIRTLENVFPPGRADKYLPSSQPDLDYWVHVAKFLHSIDVSIPSAAVWNAVGAYYFVRDESQSREAFARAIEVAPEEHSSYTTLGMWYLRRHDTNEAKKNFEKSVVLASKQQQQCPWAHVGLAAVARDSLHLSDGGLKTLARKNLDDHRYEARRIFEDQLRKDPTDYWAHNGLAWTQLYDTSPKLADIENTLQEALKLKTDFDGARYNLACVFARQKKTTEAVFQLRNIITKEAAEKLKLLGLKSDKDFMEIAEEPLFKNFLEAVGLRD